MWALKVTRSTMAATSRGSGNTDPHSLNGRFVPMPIEARSSRSVMIWNSSSAPRGSIWTYPSFIEQEQVEPPVAADHAGQLAFVGGFDELVDQLWGGDVADPAALFAGSDTERDEQVGFAGAGVVEQHDRFAGVHVGAGRERGEVRRWDAGNGVEVELREPLEAGEARFGDAAGAAAFEAVVDFGR